MESEENIEKMRLRSQIQHFIEIERYEKIKSLASDLITRYPEYGYGYYAMAVYENYQGRTENAIELCHKAAEYGMSRLTTGVLLMIYYDEIYDYANSDAEYYDLMQQYPFCYNAMAIHGNFLWRRGNRDEGLLLMQRAFAEDPNDPDIIKNLFTAVKNNKDSETLLKLYMDSPASDKQKLVLTGIHGIYENNWKEAKKCFKEVLGMDPTDDEAQRYMAVIELKKSLSYAASIEFCVFVKLIRFSSKDLHTFIETLLFLFTLLCTALILVEIRSVTGNRSKIETKIANFLSRSIWSKCRKWEKQNKLKEESRFQKACKIYKRKTSKFITKWIFGFSISFILLGGTFKIAEINFKQHAVMVKAEVDGFSERGYPILSYVANGKKYKVLSRDRIPNASVGSKVQVQYHSKYPDNIQYGENPFFELAVPMIILGIIVTLGYGYFVFHK